MAVSVPGASGPGSVLGDGFAGRVSPAFLLALFARLSFDFWIIQLIMLISAISRIMTSCSICVVSSAVRHQLARASAAPFPR